MLKDPGIPGESIVRDHYRLNEMVKKVRDILGIVEDPIGG